MDSQLPTVEKTQDRLVRLERDNRRLKHLGATTIVIVDGFDWETLDR